ncbi:sulfite exporter TauE/SafE family protein [Sphingomonas donggukensis]|uniref:Probable membrane transporter protein n=1 Tax=Sphingomonas donggukensis TaxID=2949093 RepID=A0ABY4TU55_9SPHN|nr:sulfite exporter TauE/SafE family protein [Sphingomonas donggukensis]URW75926.1 sulfite exporter TauE/SafE family protein [Sphingomonas donggukensis]
MTAIDPLYSLAGVFVGMLVGMTGVGGGSLMTPILVLAFGIHPVTAVGTDLLYASATKSVGTVVHGHRGTVDWRVVRRLATGSIPMTLITLATLSRAGTGTKAMGEAIAVVLGAALLLTAVAILFRARIVARMGPWFDGIAERRIAGLTILLGAILGALVSLTSVGAGALGMTALLVLYPRLPVNRLVGSDIAHAVPLTLIAGAGHWAMGGVDFALLLSLLAGSIPGIIAGSLIATRVSERVLTPILAVTLAIVGAKLLL